MPDYVLDASAILALLQNEPGADYVRARVERTNSIISAVNLAEVGYKMVEHGLSGAQVRETMIEFGVEVRPFDAEQAMILADLYVPDKKPWAVARRSGVPCSGAVDGAACIDRGSRMA